MALLEKDGALPQGSDSQHGVGTGTDRIKRGMAEMLKVTVFREPRAKQPRANQRVPGGVLREAVGFGTEPGETATFSRNISQPRAASLWM